MTSANKLTRISPAEFDGVLDEARAGHWTGLVLLGPGVGFGERPEAWPEEWKLAPRVIQLTTHADGLAGKLLHLPGLTSLNLSGNSVSDEGSKAVAASGNKEAGELLDQFNEELAKPEPRKSLLKRSWDGLVQVLPTVTTVANATTAVAKLFGGI